MYSTRLAMTRGVRQVLSRVTMQNNIIKIKAHLKLRQKSVGQGRGGMEGTVRPSQL
jgi:hypothetical protein